MQPSDRPEADQDPVILLLNHNRDDLTALREALVAAGYAVMEAGSLGESHRILQRARPDVAILNPLILKAGGVEMELLEDLQRDREPVPVILLVPDALGLEHARSLNVPFRDFIVRPNSMLHGAAEAVHRVELALRNRRRFHELMNRAKYLEGQVSVDFKTGLLSERYFRRLLQVEFKRAQRHQVPLSLLIVDVDNFKAINDSTEYAFGDLVLKQVAESLRQNVRDIDYPARMGGDEFVVLLPNTTAAQAVQTALRIRQRIGGMTVRQDEYESGATVSIGIDAYDGRSQRPVDSLLSNANKALQEAKRRGKNQVWLFTEANAAD